MTSSLKDTLTKIRDDMDKIKNEAPEMTELTAEASPLDSCPPTIAPIDSPAGTSL